MKKENGNSKLMIIVAIAIVVIIAIVGGVVMKSKKKTIDTSTTNTTNKVNTGNEETQEQKEEPQEITKTNYMNIDGLYVDNSYKDENKKNLKLLYIFYTLGSKDKNLKTSSIYTTVKVNGINTYQTEFIPDVCKYMGSYYYSSYVTELYGGDETLKIVETVKIPKNDLEKGKTITLEDSDIPEIKNIRLKTDNIIFCDNAKSIAQKADPKGYKKEMKKRENADTKTTAKVKKAINGYEWSFYVNTLSYTLTFISPNKFELRTSLGSNSGTYKVKNNYIFCTYPSNGYTIEIPYSWKKGKIDLDVTTAFDVKE